MKASLFFWLLTAIAVQAADATSDRFRQLVDAVQKAAHQHPDGSERYFAELERGFRQLQKKFPKEAEVYNELLFVADHRPKEEALRLAKEILEWPAPDSTKGKARGVIAKLDSLGKPWQLALTNIEGRPIDLSQWKGRVILIDFWATWCPPCREGLPELKRLYSTRHPRGLEIIGVSFDDNLDALKKFIVKEPMPWTHVADGNGLDGPMAARLGITSLPTMWLIDRKGRLREIHARNDLRAKLERLLREPP